MPSELGLARVRHILIAPRRVDPTWSVKPGHDGVWCGADAQPRRQFLGRAADGISDRARAGRADHGEADEEGSGGDGGGGVRSTGVVRNYCLASASIVMRTVDSTNSA
jgi:hypothetical protein